MSMILDALARAQREREQGVSSQRSALSFEETGGEKKRPILPWVVGALLVNALVISILLVIKPWNNIQAVEGQRPETVIKATPQESIVLAKQQQEAVVVGPPATQKSESVDPVAAASNDTVESLAAQTVVSKSAVSPKTTLVEPPKIVKKPLVQSVPTDTQVLVDSVSTSQRALGGKDYVLIKDLSANEKSAYSRYEINVHVFDPDPVKSFVLINMTRLRNGDRIPGGPVVDRITPEGVVLAQNGKKVLLERN